VGVLPTLDIGFDPGKLAVGGLSAGAGLAAALALMARDRGGPALCFAVAARMVSDRLAALGRAYAALG
jgi:acetyl esterase/lipase